MQQNAAGQHLNLNCALRHTQNASDIFDMVATDLQRCRCAYEAERSWFNRQTIIAPDHGAR
jgi:hypothetical protein